MALNQSGLSSSILDLFESGKNPLSTSGTLAEAWSSCINSYFLTAKDPLGNGMLSSIPAATLLQLTALFALAFVGSGSAASFSNSLNTAIVSLISTGVMAPAIYLPIAIPPVVNVPIGSNIIVGVPPDKIIESKNRFQSILTLPSSAPYKTSEEQAAAISEAITLLIKSTVVTLTYSTVIAPAAAVTVIVSQNLL